MAKEVSELKPFTILGLNGTVITVNYTCVSTMLDGKIKAILSDVSNNGRCNCVFCGATPTQMSKARGILHSFKPSPQALQLGIGPLHSMLRAFDWVCKFKFHEKFKLWSCW